LKEYLICSEHNDYTFENRNIIIDYIRDMGVIDPQEEHNWSILPIETAGRLIFRSTP